MPRSTIRQNNSLAKKILDWQMWAKKLITTPKGTKEHMLARVKLYRIRKQIYALHKKGAKPTTLGKPEVTNA